MAKPCRMRPILLTAPVPPPRRTIYYPPGHSINIPHLSKEDSIDSIHRDLDRASLLLVQSHRLPLHPLLLCLLLTRERTGRCDGGSSDGVEGGCDQQEGVSDGAGILHVVPDVELVDQRHRGPEHDQLLVETPPEVVDLGSPQAQESGSHEPALPEGEGVDDPSAGGVVEFGVVHECLPQQLVALQEDHLEDDRDVDCGEGALVVDDGPHPHGCVAEGEVDPRHGRPQVVNVAVNGSGVGQHVDDSPHSEEGVGRVDLQPEPVRNILGGLAHCREEGDGDQQGQQTGQTQLGLAQEQVSGEVPTHTGSRKIIFEASFRIGNQVAPRQTPNPKDILELVSFAASDALEVEVACPVVGHFLLTLQVDPTGHQHPQLQTNESTEQHPQHQRALLAQHPLRAQLHHPLRPNVDRPRPEVLPQLTHTPQNLLPALRVGGGRKHLLRRRVVRQHHHEHLGHVRRHVPIFVPLVLALPVLRFLKSKSRYLESFLGRLGGLGVRPELGLYGRWEVIRSCRVPTQLLEWSLFTLYFWEGALLRAVRSRRRVEWVEGIVPEGVRRGRRLPRPGTAAVPHYDYKRLIGLEVLRAASG